MIKKIFIGCLLLTVCCIINTRAQATKELYAGGAMKPRIRVITDNDFSGDPDGLFQLAHLLLSPSVEVRGIIGSHLKAGDWFDPSKTQAHDAARKAAELLGVMNLAEKVTVVAGSDTAMRTDDQSVKSEAVNLIIKEALRTDTKTPLYVICGAGLTEIASALLTRPEIAEKLTLVWIGGPEYPDLALPPPGSLGIEYNLNIDINAAKVIFNKSAVKLWQVPRNAYREAILSGSEILLKIKPYGEIGRYLTAQLEYTIERLKKNGVDPGETYILGDSPLVLLTALQSPFEPDPSSSTYVIKTAPKINDRGQYEFGGNGRPIRVYNYLDTRLMFNDFFAKLELFSAK